MRIMHVTKKLNIAFKATRAETLVASIFPILAGNFLALKNQKFSFTLFILTLLFGIFLHIATNLVNDYFDFVNKVDDENRIAEFSTIQTKETTLSEIKFYYRLSFLFAFIIGLYFAYIGKLIALSLFLFPFLAAYFYTAGKKPLGYIGLGDLLVLIFFGPFATVGSFYLQTYIISKVAFIIGLSQGFIVTAILITNNLRDITPDKKAFKNTLAVIFGKKFAQIEYIICILLSFFSAIYLCYITKNLLFILSALSLLIAPFNTVLTYINEKELNKALQKTVLTLSVFSIFILTAILF